MCKKEKLAFGIALLAAATSCSVDEITIPAEELIHREFIKSYGQIDPNHDWSVIKSSSITVTSPQEADVRVFARDKNGKTIIVADYHDFSGTETIHFDVPKEVENVYVQSGSQFHTVTLGESVSLAPARSRAIDGKDSGILDYVSSRDSVFGYMWEYEYVKAFADVVGEGEAQKNLDKDNITTDFSFIASDQPFVFYPMYWNTGSHNVLGVYWYENGELKTRDIFQNRLVNGWDKRANSSNPHNMFRRATKGPSDITIDSSPKDNATEVARSGNITLNFSVPVKWSGTCVAELIPRPDVEDLQNIILGEPILSSNGKTATFAYSGIAPNTLYSFSLPAGAFTATNISSLTTKAYSFDFRSVVITPIPVSITPDYAEPIPMSGTITITYDKEIVEGIAGAKATLTSVSGNDNAVIIDEGIVSGKTLTFTYTVSLPEEEYKFSLSSGAVKSKAYDEPNLGTEYTFTTAKKTIEYEPAATIVNINKPTADNGIYQSGEIIASNDNLSVKIITTETSDVRPKSNVWEYIIPGFADKQILTPQIQCKSNTKPPFADKYAGGPNGNSNAIFEIEVKQEMVLSVFGSSKKELDVSSANIHLLTHNSLTEVSTRARVLSGTMSDRKQVCFVYVVTPGLYTLCYDSSGGGSIAGFACQLVTAHYDNTTPPATRYINSHIFRADSRATNELTETERLIYPDTVAAKNAGFSRSLANAQSSYVNNNGPDGGEDDIVTHRISINLPKGTVFGFYIRNNHGADNVTNRKDPNDTSEKPNGNAIVKPYTNYSMSNLNQELGNSFFNSLDETKTEEFNKYKDGWGKDKTSYLTKTERKFSTAATYRAPNGYRYFSFEDWVDADLNDIVFMIAPESNNEIIDLEVKTNPYIFAVEDLGATAVTNSDIDFNDAVFGVEHVTTNKSQDYVFVTMLAAGGTLKTQLYFGDAPVDGITNGQSIVHGPHVGTGKRLSHINEWFAVDSHTTTINVGNGGHGFGNLTTVRIPVEKGFTLGAIRGEAGKFSVRVDRPDGQTQVVTRPKAEGLAPQILILPGEWKWPKEGMAIHDAYPGGINYDGTLFGSFADWVKKCYDVTTNSWHENPTTDYVIDNPWKGSQAARDEIKNNTKDN